MTMYVAAMNGVCMCANRDVFSTPPIINERCDAERSDRVCPESVKFQGLTSIDSGFASKIFFGGDVVQTLSITHSFSGAS